MTHDEGYIPIGQPQTAGFGGCRRCTYREQGTIDICYTCARRTQAEIPQPRCKVCDHPVTAESTTCGNFVCDWVPPRRAFTWCHAVALRQGALEKAISEYKYDGVRGWKLIFGRVLAGYLDEHIGELTEFDLVIPSPTYVGRDGRSFDHTAGVLEEAARLHRGGLPIDTTTGVIVKTAPTERLAPLKWSERRVVCDTQIRPALKVNQPRLVEGRRILLYDDVFTEGLLLNTVATVLRENGARDVCQITLARQPRRGY